MNTEAPTEGDQRDALCVGETMVLITPPQQERLGFSDSLMMAIAGAESNVAQYLADLGHRVAWSSRLGRDPLGEFIHRTLAETGVDTSTVAFDDAAPTGVMFRDPAPTGSQVFYYRTFSAASRMGPAEAASIDLARWRIVHLSGVTPALSASCRELVWAMLERSKAVGSLCSFDVNYRPKLWGPSEAGPELLQLAAAADLVFVGRDEAESLWGAETPHAVRTLIGRHNHLVVKDGAIGATCFEPGSAEGTFVPTPPIEVVEPTGAGDAFAAGYLSGVLHGMEAHERLQLGHRTAAVALSTTADHVSLSSVIPGAAP